MHPFHSVLLALALAAPAFGLPAGAPIGQASFAGLVTESFTSTHRTCSGDTPLEVDYGPLTGLETDVQGDVWTHAFPPDLGTAWRLSFVLTEPTSCGEHALTYVARGWFDAGACQQADGGWSCKVVVVDDDCTYTYATSIAGDGRVRYEVVYDCPSNPDLSEHRLAEGTLLRLA